MPKDLYSYLPLALVLLIVLRRAGRSRTVRIQRMWITPVLSLAAVASVMMREPVPGLAASAILVLATAAGIGSGYFRALHTELSIDPETGGISSKATTIGTYLIVGFLALRIALDYAINGSFTPGPPRFVNPSIRGVDLFRLADAALLFSTSMTIAQRAEIWRRAQKLIKQHREGAAEALPSA